MLSVYFAFHGLKFMKHPVMVRCNSAHSSLYIVIAIMVAPNRASIIHSNGNRFLNAIHNGAASNQLAFHKEEPTSTK